jgi:hypothetical protein
MARPTKKDAAIDYAARASELIAEKARLQQKLEDATEKLVTATSAVADAKAARDAVLLAAKVDGSETAQAELNQHTASLIAATLERDDWKNAIEQLGRRIIDADQQIEAAKQRAAQDTIKDIAVNELLPLCERLDRALDDVGRLLNEILGVKATMSKAAADGDLIEAKGARRFTLHHAPWLLKLKLGRYASGYVHHALAGQTFASIERGFWGLGPAVEMDEPTPTETKAA